MDVFKNKTKGLKFRRQHPVRNYILDFYCHQLKLAIEADGSIHDKEESKITDLERQNYIESMGIVVIRFTNDEIQRHMESVIEKINLTIDECQKRN